MSLINEHIELSSAPAAEPIPPAAPIKKWGRSSIAATILAVGLVSGGATYAITHTTSSTGATRGTSAAAGAAPGGGTAGGAAGARMQPPHGTIVSTTASTITVKLSTGTTTTYTLDSGGVVQNNGATSSLAALTVGEQVAVLTGQPGSTSTVATQILAGTSATAGPTGGGSAGGTGQLGTPPTQAVAG